VTMTEPSSEALATARRIVAASPQFPRAVPMADGGIALRFERLRVDVYNEGPLVIARTGADGRVTYAEGSEADAIEAVRAVGGSFPASETFRDKETPC
jgi:hypothetical protein